MSKGKEKTAENSESLGSGNCLKIQQKQRRRMREIGKDENTIEKSYFVLT